MLAFLLFFFLIFTISKILVPDGLIDLCSVVVSVSVEVAIDVVFAVVVVIEVVVVVFNEFKFFGKFFGLQTSLPIQNAVCNIQYVRGEGKMRDFGKVVRQSGSFAGKRERSKCPSKNA